LSLNRFFIFFVSDLNDFHASDNNILPHNRFSSSSFVIIATVMLRQEKITASTSESGQPYIFTQSENRFTTSAVLENIPWSNKLCSVTIDDDFSRKDLSREWTDLKRLRWNFVSNSDGGGWWFCFRFEHIWKDCGKIEIWINDDFSSFIFCSLSYNNKLKVSVKKKQREGYDMIWRRGVMLCEVDNGNEIRAK
jgi:hypothetical protein